MFRRADMRWLMEQAGGRPVIEYCGGTEIGGGYITGTIAKPCVAGEFNTLALGLDAVILNETGEAATTGEMFLVPPSIGLSTQLLCWPGKKFPTLLVVQKRLDCDLREASCAK